MIIGIGADLIDAARFDGLEANVRLMDRLFTEDEKIYIGKKGYRSAAGLFAAKEAAVKAVGTGFAGFWPRDVEITRDEYGKPGVAFHGKAKKLADERGVKKMHVSITHTDASAAAFAVATDGENPTN